MHTDGSFENDGAFANCTIHQMLARKGPTWTSQQAFEQSLLGTRTFTPQEPQP